MRNFLFLNSDSTDSFLKNPDPLTPCRNNSTRPLRTHLSLPNTIHRRVPLYTSFRQHSHTHRDHRGNARRGGEKKIKPDVYPQQQRQTVGKRKKRKRKSKFLSRSDTSRFINTPLHWPDTAS